MTERPEDYILTGMPLQHLRTYLDALQPGLFNAGLAALLFVALWGVRRWKPLFFAKLPPALQAWPAMASGALIAALSASTDGDFIGALVNALGMAGTGLVSGMLSVGVHRTLKESPTPYGVDQIPPKKDPAPMVTRISGLMVFLLVVAIPGCASFGKFNPTAKTAIATVDDIARRLCELAHADSLGVSPQEIAAGVCAAERAFAPFRPYVLAAKRDGAQAAGLAKKPDAAAP